MGSRFKNYIVDISNIAYDSPFFGDPPMDHLNCGMGRNSGDRSSIHGSGYANSCHSDHHLDRGEKASSPIFLCCGKPGYKSPL